jgi:hypothetical protein
MTAALIVTGIIAFLAAWQYFLYRLSGRRPLWNPVWAAFTLTAVGLLYGAAGVLGYSVPLHNPVIDQPVVWVGHVVWRQVGFGSAEVLASVVFWWLGLKELR